MNTNLLNIVKQIIAEKGEDILADPQKLKPLFSDYAKDEPKAERAAFGRCLEMGSYQELKNTSSAAEMRKKKAALADQLNAKHGIDKALCTDALDLLEAVISRQEQPPASPPQSSTPSGGNAKASTRITKRTFIFGIAGALGGGIGSLIGGFIVADMGRTMFTIIMHWGIWVAAVAIGVALGLLVAQNIYLKKKILSKSIGKTVIIGLCISVATGIIAALPVVFGNNESMEIITRLISWIITGLGIGLTASLFILNYPKKRAMAAGLLGGAIGGIIVRLIGSLIYGSAGVLVGDMILGFVVGLSVSVVEEVLRQAWLTIIWGKNETTTVSLGDKPVVFGSSPKADIYLPNEAEPVRASVQIENSRVVMQDNKTNQRKVLRNGDRVDFGKVSFEVSTKKD